MAIAVTNTAALAISSASSRGFSMTNDGGTVVLAIINQNVIGTPSPTYGGVSMTLVSTALGRAFLFHLPNAPTGSNSFSYSGTSGSNAGCGYSLSGVKTSSPIGSTGNDSSGSSISTTLGGITVGSITIDVAMGANSSTAQPSPTALGGRTAGLSLNNGLSVFASSHRITTGTSDTSSWTGTYANLLEQQVVEFKPEPQPPVITTGAQSELFSTTTTVSGNEVTDEGDESVTDRGVAYALSTEPTILDSTVSTGSGLGVFASDLSGLAGGNTYYARAYATSAIQTSYGSEISFRTDENVANMISILDNPVEFN